MKREFEYRMDRGIHSSWRWDFDSSRRWEFDYQIDCEEQMPRRIVLFPGRQECHFDCPLLKTEIRIMMKVGGRIGGRWPVVTVGRRG